MGRINKYNLIQGEMNGAEKEGNCNLNIDRWLHISNRINNNNNINGIIQSYKPAFLCK